MADQYKIYKETLEQIAEYTRRLTGVRENMTPDRIIWWLSKLTSNWTLKSTTLEDFTKFDITTPKTSVKDCNCNQSHVLQDEFRLNNYTVLQKNDDGSEQALKRNNVVNIFSPPEITLFNNIKENLNELNPHAGDKVIGLELYDENYIITNPDKLISLRSQWNYAINSIIPEYGGSMGVIEVNTDIFNDNNITSVRLVQI